MSIAAVVASTNLYTYEVRENDAIEPPEDSYVTTDDVEKLGTVPRNLDARIVVEAPVKSTFRVTDHWTGYAFANSDVYRLRLRLDTSVLSSCPGIHFPASPDEPINLFSSGGGSKYHDVVKGDEVIYELSTQPEANRQLLLACCRGRLVRFAIVQRVPNDANHTWVRCLGIYRAVRLLPAKGVGKRPSISLVRMRHQPPVLTNDDPVGAFDAERKSAPIRGTSVVDEGYAVTFSYSLTERQKEASEEAERVKRAKSSSQ